MKEITSMSGQLKECSFEINSRFSAIIFNKNIVRPRRNSQEDEKNPFLNSH